MSNFHKRLEATARALAKKPNLSLKTGSNLPVDYLSHSEEIALSSFGEITKEKRTQLRGEADMAALSLRFHNPKIHTKMRPSAPQAAEIFDALERTRIEIKGSEHWQGVRGNLHELMEQYCKNQGYDNLTGRAEPPIADLLAFMLREEVLGIKPPQAIAGLVDKWRESLGIMAGRMLSQLPEYIENQTQFAKKINEIIKTIPLKKSDEDSNQAGEESKGEAIENPESSEEQHESESDESSADSESQTMPSEGEGSQAEEGFAYEEDATTQNNNLQNEFAKEARNISGKGDFASLLDNKEYHIFTRQFDEIVDAEKLASVEEATRLRQTLDQKLITLHKVTAKLVSRLQHLFLARQARIFEYRMEEGIIDSKSLVPLVIDPNFQSIYKKEKETDYLDTVVTLLIDNSGSMRGRPITVAALCADILSRTLERCGVKVEVLGFTTRDWKGGQSRKLWLEKGRTLDAGRLNDIRHIVYKSANTRWQKARRNLGIMLKEGILKENIDGEAILWANNRLLARPEQRRILMVISDGAPVDDSTLSSNNGGYLDRHLVRVIKAIETYSPVELVAIGIGHDVTRYYKQAVTISDVNQLGDVMAKELVRIFK